MTYEAISELTLDQLSHLLRGGRKERDPVEELAERIERQDKLYDDVCAMAGWSLNDLEWQPVSEVVKWIGAMGIKADFTQVKYSVAQYIYDRRNRNI
jgi:hypothetical protein